MLKRLRSYLVAVLACVPALPHLVHAAGPEASRCRYLQMADLPIRYAGTSLVPAIDGALDGTAATMLVDTGSEISSLTMNAVTRRNLRLAMSNQHAIGVGGFARIYTTHLKDLAIGAIHRDRGMDMMVIGDTGFTPGFDAILGAPFLLQMDMLLDLPAKRLRLYKPQDCDKNALLLWDEPTVVLPFTNGAKDRANPHFTVLVNGKTMDAAIDSGAHHSVMTLDAAKRAGLDVQGPGATRLHDVAGIGTDRAPHWSVPVRTVQIGDETVRDAEIGVVDARGGAPVDMFLGQDFLRAHRVLFAMNQKKLYVAYVGGNAFTRSTGVEPWMQQEAEAGNADAQYVLSTLTGTGPGVARDAAQAEAWLQKAALQGQPHAKLALGRRAVQAGDAASAIPQLRAALEALPAERYGPLWLYLARLRNGEAELARTELAVHLKAQQDDDWPTPIAQFYLGKWDAARLLQEAGADKQAARSRGCQAERYIAEWHAARGDADRAATMKAAMAGRCGRDGGG